MKKQINAALLFGLAIVVGFVALGVSEGQQPDPAEKDSVLESEEVVPTDQLILEELKKTNQILVNWVRADLKEKAVTTELLTEIKEQNEGQLNAAKRSGTSNASASLDKIAKDLQGILEDLDESIEDLEDDNRKILNAVDSMDYQLGSSRTSIIGYLEDIMKSLR